VNESMLCERKKENKNKRRRIITRTSRRGFLLPWKVPGRVFDVETLSFITKTRIQNGESGVIRRSSRIQSPLTGLEF
jgi:hypothetical protein